MAADRVIARVSGLLFERAGRRLLFVFQAAIDESYEPDGIFVVGGYIATAESWAHFSNLCERMAPHFGTVRDDGRYHFKMSEMAMRPDGIAKSAPLFRLIEDHTLAWLSAKIDRRELRGALARMSIPGAIIEDWGGYANPWYIAFRCLMDMFHLERPKLGEVFGEEKIDFYFDDGMDKKTVFEFWDNYIKNRPDEIRKYYGQVPRFKDDMDFLPLQAADFWVWWVREWYLRGTPEKVMRPDFGAYRLRGEKYFLRIDINFDEDQLVKNLIQTVRQQIRPDRQVFDSKTGESFYGTKED